MKHAILKLTLVPILMIFSAWIGWQGNTMFSDIETQVVTEKKATTIQEDWGHIVIYTDESSTTTYGTKNMLTAKAVIKPGMEIHPPHQHTQEEFMYIVEGRGTWSMNGVESSAKAGDVMYARPWDMHGITNTSNKPLTFFVVKWDNKGMELPVLGEE